MIDHIGDNAALYALGMLDESESLAVLQHAASCDACSRLLAQAEDDVAAMAAAQTQLEPPAVLRPLRPRVTRRAWSAPALAFAAALVIALLPMGYLVNENRAMHDSVAYADAVERMVNSPHKQVAFKGTDAMVMYGNDGSWYCIFARGAKAFHVAWLHDGQQTMLGEMVTHGDVAMLYLPKSHKMNQLAIMSDGQVLSTANLVF